MSSFEVGTYNKYYTMDKHSVKKELVTMMIDKCQGLNCN